jgi:diguanylate cyclase (GGDEF)-like protein
MDDPASGSSRLLGIAADVTERIEAREHLAHLALHDPLTGLGNHLLLLDRLEHAIARAKRSGSALTVLVVDIQDFRAVNESLGKETGDRVLTAVAHRLRGTLRDEDTLVRLGDDAFVALLEGTAGTADVGRAAARLSAAFEMPFSADGVPVELAASVVSAVSQAGSLTAADVGRLADEALHRVRVRERTPDRRGRLRQALEQREFRVLYQPVVDLATNDVVGLEALLRWQHPERGLLLPGEFLRLAEESGLIHPIGSWVLRRVCEDLRSWESAQSPLRDAWAAVNVSQVQFEMPDFVAEVVRILDTAGVLPSRLRLEVDESTWFRARLPLRRLRDLGVAISVDRFGERYGALGALRRLPVDTLKLSRRLGFGPFGKKESTSSVGSIVGLASGLGLGVTAVGVETLSELRSLREIGCTAGQGYYFTPALDEEALRGWLAHGGPGGRPAPSARYRQN